MNVSVTDVDELTLQRRLTATTLQTVDENASAGTVGITASASDADGTNNTVTYSLTNDDGNFVINSAQAL